MSSKMAEIAGCILCNHMGFLLYTALKKITDLFFHNGIVFLCVIVLEIVSINPCTTFKTTFGWI